MITFFVPTKTRSLTNMRGHWSQRAKLAKHNRSDATYALRSVLGTDRSGYPIGPFKVTLIRHGWGKLDSDNLASALKSVRDGIADVLGIDDGDDAIEFFYPAQVTTRDPAKYGVAVTIEFGVQKEKSA